MTSGLPERYSFWHAVIKHEPQKGEWGCLRIPWVLTDTLKYRISNWVTVTSRYITSDSLFAFLLQHVRICLQRYLKTLSNYMASWYCPQATRWSLVPMRKTSWWMTSCYCPCRTQRHSALSRHEPLDTLFSACLVAELSAAPANSSPVVSPCNHQYPAPRQTRSSCLLPRRRRGLRRVLWSVNGWIRSAEETLQENLKHWKSKLSQPHLVHHESHINAWNQTRPSAMRGRWLAA